MWQQQSCHGMCKLLQWSLFWNLYINGCNHYNEFGNEAFKTNATFVGQNELTSIYLVTIRQSARQTFSLSVYRACVQQSNWVYIGWFLNTLRPRQNGRNFPEDVLKWIFVNENEWILIKISLKFVPRGPINNMPALVQIMAWCRQCNKPLSEPMMVNLLTHICVTRPQWVKILWKGKNGW